jgi:hypothetical protein
MENISEHITYKEATTSNKAIALGIDNKPNLDQLYNMGLVANLCFEPLRKWYGKPIKINSFFRNPETNKVVNGSKTSDHMQGKAIDLTAGNKTENKKLFDWLKANVEFSQLINEYDYTWVHISYDKNNLKKQILSIK